MEINIKPLGDRVVIQPIETETKTASGIYIPDSAKEKSNTAIVVAVSKSENIDVKVGERVIYAEHSGTNIEHDGQKYIILEINEILAII